MITNERCGMIPTQLSHPNTEYALIKWGAAYSGNSIRQGIKLTHAINKK